MIFRLSVLLLFLVPFTAQSQSTSGTVTFENAPKTAVRRSPYGKPAAASTTDNIRIAAIWVEGTTAPPRSEPAYLDQQEIQFSPRFLVIRQGEKVRVRNNDPVYHNVFSLSSVKKFDIGRRQKGEFVDVLFEKTGVVQVFCDIHSDMSAEILVIPSSAGIVVTSDAQGRFVLPQLPAGTYTVKAYAQGFKEFSKSVTFPVSSLEIKLQGR